MFHIALYQPEIPPNTGNIIRLCANAGSQLHLIHPLGFSLDDKQLIRAGLDYHEQAIISEHETYRRFRSRQKTLSRLFAFSTKAKTSYETINYRAGDCFLFGPETRGLPDTVMEELPESQVLRIPMLPNNRSLNLSNAVAIVLYEAWRQQDFLGKALI